VFATAVGLNTEMSDTDEAPWQHVEQETLDEGRRINVEDLLCVSSPSVAIAKGHTTVVKSHQTLVADGNAVSVAAKVPKHLGGAGHGCFGVDDPILGRSLLQKGTSERGADSGRSCFEGVIEALKQLASEDFGQHAHWHEETRAGRNPVVAPGVEATTRDDAVDVWMKGQGLGPGVKNGDRTRGGAQPTLADSMEGRKGGLEQQPVGPSPFSKKEGMQGGRYREHQVKVGHGEKTERLGLHPSSLLQALTLGAMAVSAGVVERLFPTAVVAHLEMAAHERRSTLHDVLDHPTAIAAELLQGRGVRPEDVRQLQRAAPSQGRQRLPRRRLPQSIQWALGLPQILAGHVGVPFRGA
jgi:hypothetical protein